MVEISKKTHLPLPLCTLQMMKQEIMFPYQDFRKPREEPTPERLFKLITGEDITSLWPGKPVTGIVKQFVRRKPTDKELEDADAPKREDDGFWLCKYCDMPFEDLPELWAHVDNKQCKGRALGIKVELDCGVNGFCRTMFMSSSKISKPEERVQIGQIVHFRILKEEGQTVTIDHDSGKTKTYHFPPIDFEKLSVNLTSRSEDLKCTDDADPECDLDEYFDQLALEDMKKKEKMSRHGIVDEETNTRQVKYYTRNIDHANFLNIPRDEAYKKLLEEYAEGEPIFRPSSKGPNYLNASFKIDQSPIPIIIDQVITEDPSKKDPKKPTTLSKKLLIDNEEFEDLDEIIARYISALIGNIEDLKRYKYYFVPEGQEDVDSEKTDKNLIYQGQQLIIDKKKAAPRTIPYWFWGVK